MSGRPNLLACFAHPDDESYGVAGTIARYAAAGARCAVLTATAGEAGEIFGNDIPRERLAEVRIGELAAACEVIGAESPLFLGYPDGGLADADQDELVGKIVDCFESVQPDAVLTFDRTGVTGHADHRAMHHAVTRAFSEWTNPSSRLYYICIPEVQLEETRKVMESIGVTEFPFPLKRWDDSADPAPDGSDGPHFVPNSWVTHRLDNSRFVEKKRTAILCHKSQIDPEGFPAAIPAPVFEKLFGVEYFTLAGGPPTNSKETLVDF